MVPYPIRRKIKVSIITVVKNAETVLQTLFNSVKKYKSDEIEFIVVDGESQDNTLAIIKKNENIIDRWQSAPDTGIYDAMNKGVKLAKGEWLIFMGADDELLYGFKQIIPFLTEKNTVYYGKVIFHNQFITGEIKNSYMLSKTNICHQAIFYPKNVFKNYRYKAEYIICADYVLNLTLWADPAFKFIYLNYLIADFAEGGFSTNTVDILFERDRLILFNKYLNPENNFLQRYLTGKTVAYKIFKRLMVNN